MDDLLEVLETDRIDAAVDAVKSDLDWLVSMVPLILTFSKLVLFVEECNCPFPGIQ